MASSDKTIILPAYLVVGTDMLKREDVLRRLRIRLEKLGDLSFNQDTFNGSKDTGEAIVAACETLPFASEKRLVIVEMPEKLHKADQEVLISYLEDPAPTAVLLLVADSLAKNTRLYKAVAKVGERSIIDCTPPKTNDLPTMIRKMADDHGSSIDAAAAQTLISLVGEDTVRLDKEIQKLALLTSSAGHITQSDINDNVAKTTEYKPWDLTDAFADRDISSTLIIMRNMPSTSPHVMLRQCVSKTREMLGLKALSDVRGASENEIADFLKLSPKLQGNARRSVMNRRIRAAKNFSTQELRDMLCKSVEVERRMKSGYDPNSELTDWIIESLA